MLSIAGSLEAHSAHPLSACVIASAVNASAPLSLPVSEFQAIPGKSCAQMFSDFVEQTSGTVFHTLFCSAFLLVSCK